MLIEKFPESPSVNQKHTVGGRTWVYDGSQWRTSRSIEKIQWDGGGPASDFSKAITIDGGGV